MSAIEIRPVRTYRQRRTFLTVPWRIYRGDPLWVPPLLPDRARIIDARRGPFFQHGEAEFYVAWREGRPVGTICVAEDPEYNEMSGLRECTFGFFECIEDYAVAEAMLGMARDWAAARGLDMVVGPYNLDREDGYGLLVEGRDRPPVVLCGHTPPYYQDYVERFGFEKARGDALAFAVTLDETPALARLARLADRVRKRERIVIRQADMAHVDAEVDRVHKLLVESLAHLPNYVPWRRSEVQALLDPFVQLADPELILFADVDGETVGWFAGIANWNEALRYGNGLRYPWDYVRLWWHARPQPACLAVKSVLVLPEYWDSGVSVLLFDEMARRARAKGYRWIDLSLTGEDNPYTPAIATRMGAEIYKRYRVYGLDVNGGTQP
jgi:GNAT superfamily N-acetyltransferase